MLAYIYYHATLIFLSGTFDYHLHWKNRHITIPTLPPEVIQDRVTAILTMVSSALKQTSLAGILFFFPLRVVGARAHRLEHRAEIARMLGDISRRGFVVADSFTMDLEALWERKRISMVL